MNDSLKRSLNRHHGKQEQAPLAPYIPPAEVVDPFHGKWNEHVVAAKSAWGLLGVSELVRSEGRRSNLAWLIQGRYTMSSTDANNQIDNFMLQCGV